MRRRVVRPAAAAVVVLASVLTAGGALSASAAVGASPVGLSACTASSGVLVAVDFSHWRGAVDLGCASGREADGLDAMHNAGFLTAGDDADGDAFVCRIGVAAQGTTSERPTPTEDSCVSTPPASAYWAFWVSDAGQSAWSYSQSGVESYQPPAGSTEGWAFGSGGPPSVTPAQLRAEASQPPTTTAPPKTTVPTLATTSTTLASTVPSTTARRSGRGRRTSSTTAATPTTTRPSRIVAVASRAGIQPPGGSGGTPTGVLVTVAIVAFLVATGAAVTWRRRRAA